VWAFGGNFTLILSAYELHGDWVYVRTEDDEGKDPLIKESYFFGGIGGQKAFMEDRLTLSLDLLIKWIKNFEEEVDPIDSMLLWESRKLSFQHHRLMPYLSFHTSLRDKRDTWKLTTFGIYDFKAKEPFFILSLDHNPIDGLKFTLGALLSGKEGKSPFTQMGKHLGQVLFFETKYSY
jgi:hypothetical protein